MLIATLILLAIWCVYVFMALKAYNEHPDLQSKPTLFGLGLFYGVWLWAIVSIGH